MTDICILVTNDLEHDPRVVKEARSLSNHGFRVAVVGYGDESAGSHAYQNYQRILISPGPFYRSIRWLGRHYAAVLKPADRAQAGMPYAGNTHYQRVRSLFTRTGLREFERRRHMLKAVLATKAKVIQCCDYDTLEVGLRAAEISGAQLVYDSHELHTDSFRVMPEWFRAYIHDLETRAARRAEHVMTVSQPIAERLQELYAIPHVHVVGNFPEFESVGERPDAIRRRLQLKDDALITLYQGRYDNERGLENLIAAGQFLKKGVLVFRGYGAIEDKLKGLVRDLGLLDRVHFVEPIPMKQLVAGAAEGDIGVVPYQKTCLNMDFAAPNKLFEYLMAGIPVATNALSEMSRIVRDSRAGVVFDANNPQDIADKLNQLLLDDRQRSQLAQNARLAAKEQYNWGQSERVLFSIYEPMVRGIEKNREV